MKPSNRSKSSTANSTASPQYDLSLNPPYQINYRAKRAGKHISASKRRITFQFGFSSASAIHAGKTEVDCRGAEHEVVLIWSHITGKRQLFMDGKEVHMSRAARGNTRFEYSWTIKGNHQLKIIANGTPPMGDMARHVRQFDLELDGMSYFTFSQIYQLGRRSGSSSNKYQKRQDSPGAEAPPQDTGVSYSYRGTAYEARDEDCDDVAAPLPVTTIDLIGVDDNNNDQLYASNLDLVSPMTQHTAQFEMSNSQNTRKNAYSSQPSLAASSFSTYDEFTPVQQQQSTQKSFDAISNNIMCAYGTSNTGGTTAAPPSDVSNQSSSRALVPVSEDQMDVITKSMKNLVNLDDITTGVVQPMSKQQHSQTSSSKSNKANNWGLVGRAPTLAEMRDRGNDSPATMPKEPVMKTYPPQQHQGYYGQHQVPQQAMVAYGYQQQPMQPQQMPPPPPYGYAPAY